MLLTVILFLALAVAAFLPFVLRPMATARKFFYWLLLLRGARSGVAETATGRIHYYEIESGPQWKDTVVFITGLGGTAADWQAVMARVAARHRTYSVELAGQGQTRLKDESQAYSLQLQAELLRQFLDFKRLGSVSLVGISLGGWIACLFALKYPERLKRLILVSSAGLRNELTVTDLRPQNRAEAQVFVNRLLARDRWVPGFVLDDFVRRLNSQANCKTLESIQESDFLDDRLHRIAVPVDLIWGSGDELMTLRDAERFHTSIPDCRLHILPECGHIPMFERSRAFNNLVLQIL